MRRGGGRGGRLREGRFRSSWCWSNLREWCWIETEVKLIPSSFHEYQVALLGLCKENYTSTFTYHLL